MTPKRNELLIKHGTYLSMLGRELKKLNIYIYKSQTPIPLTHHHSRTAGLILMKVVPSDSPMNALYCSTWLGLFLPTPLAPGTKRCRPCASWRPWGPPTGLYGVSADSLGLPDAESLIGWDLAPTPLAPET